MSLLKTLGNLAPYLAIGGAVAGMNPGMLMGASSWFSSIFGGNQGMGGPMATPDFNQNATRNAIMYPPQAIDSALETPVSVSNGADWETAMKEHYETAMKVISSADASMEDKNNAIMSINALNFARQQNQPFWKSPEAMYMAGNLLSAFGGGREPMPVSSIEPQYWEGPNGEIGTWGMKPTQSHDVADGGMMPYVTVTGRDGETLYAGRGVPEQYRPKKGLVPTGGNIA